MNPAQRAERARRDRPRGRRHDRERGFTMIELLVSLLVVSLGIGGILLAQGRGHAALNGNGFRLHAAVLAEQILDRARANPTESYVKDLGATGGSGVVSRRDIELWKAQVERSLPSGDALVRQVPLTDAATATRYERIEVVVTWDDRRAGAGDKGEPKPSSMLVRGYRKTP